MKTHELQTGDKVKTEDEIFTFIMMDGDCGHFQRENGYLWIGNFGELQKQDDYYIPLSKDK